MCGPVATEESHAEPGDSAHTVGLLSVCVLWNALAVLPSHVSTCCAPARGEPTSRFPTTTALLSALTTSSDPTEARSTPRPKVPWVPLIAIVAAVVAAFYLAVREPDSPPSRAPGSAGIAPLGSVLLGAGAEHLSAALNRQEDVILVDPNQPHAYRVTKSAVGYVIGRGAGDALATLADTANAARDAQRIRNAVYVDVRAENSSAFTDIGHLQPEVRRQVLSAERLWLAWLAGGPMEWDRYRFMLTTATTQQAEALTAHERLADFYTALGAARYGLEEARAEASRHLERVIDLTPKRYGYLMQRARFYLVLELDYASARDVLQRGRMRNPDAAPNLFGLTQIALREGRIAEARELLEGAERYFAPRRATWQAAFARLAAVTGDYALARTLAATAARDTPEFRTRVEAMILAADAAVLAGDRDAARAMLAELPAGLDPALESRALVVRLALGEPGVSFEDIPSEADRYTLARAAVAAGETQVALEAIEAGLQQRDEHLLDSLRVARFWGSLRSDPQFALLLGTLTAMETRSAPPGTNP